MKLMLLLFSVFNIYNTNVEVDPNFESEMIDSYEEYALVEEYTNNYYDLQLYIGKVNEKVYYGIYFKNNIPNQYYIKISLDDKIYNLDRNQRGDTIATAIDLNNSNNFSILVYNKDGFYQYGINSFQNIETMEIDEFNSLENKIVGQGNGILSAKLKSDINMDKRLIIYIVLVSVFLVCGLIILIFYKRKKGMFNSDIKSANVFNFKEFLQSSTPSFEENQSYNNYPERDFVVSEEIVEEETKEPEKVVNQTYVWQHYEEEKSDFDFRSHLSNMNLPTNYKQASAEEKNNIMLELMRLRDQDKITHDDYLDEISELWKN